MKSGWIGLGAMGLHMARNLHEAGFLTAVWNRNAAVARDFAAETGCIAAADLHVIAEQCDAIFLCIADDAAVLEVLGALCPALRAGTLVVDCSTVAASTAVAAAELVQATGGRFLDCPVTGGTEGARKATLAVLAGGDPADFAAAVPLLEKLGSNVTLLGPVGAGQAAKAVNQVMIAGVNQAVSESLAFAQASGLDLEKVISAIGSGAAASWFLSMRGPNMARGEFPLGFKVQLHAKDLEICRAMAADLGVRLPLVEMTLLHYQRLLALPEVRQEEDISSLFRLKKLQYELSRDD